MFLEYMNNPLPEAGTLMLDSSLARNVLGWTTPWDTAQVVRETGTWYREYYANPASAGELTSDQPRSNHSTPSLASDNWTTIVLSTPAS